MYIKHDEYGLGEGTGDHIGIVHLLVATAKTTSSTFYFYNYLERV